MTGAPPDFLALLEGVAVCFRASACRFAAAVNIDLNRGSSAAMSFVPEFAVFNCTCNPV